jgi:hypothetical protein
MSKIKRLCGLRIKSSDSTGVNKNKCRVLAMWGKYLAEEPLSEEESYMEESYMEESYMEESYMEESYMEECSLPHDTDDCDKPRDEKNEPIPETNKDINEPAFVCDHELDNTGYVSLRLFKNKIITWNDGEVDKKGKTLDDLELEWNKDLKVYLSTNESDDDDQTWLRILKIL